MKVIQDNIGERKKRMAQLEQQKKADADQVETNMRMVRQKEIEREQEMAERGRRIQAVMDSMGDVVRDNGRELQLKQEKEYIQQCLEKDEKARLQDIDKKNRDRQKHERLNQVLATQIRERRMQ